LPTLIDWYNTLMTDRELSVVSSQNLVNEVQRKQSRRLRDLINQGKSAPPMKTQLTPVSMFNPLITIYLKPLSLLHAIGRITTPPVPNLADLSSTWALIRYFWAFEIPNRTTNQPLILSNIARQIDFHQKALLSDEIGMGMAYYIMTKYFKTTEVIDVSIALKEMPVNLQYSTSPDYLFFDDPNGLVYVVKCKGNQSSRPTTMDQLRRGTEQVPSIIFDDGSRAESLVIATCMLSNGTTVYIIDPIDENGNNLSDSSDFYKAEKIGPTQWRVKDYERYVMDSRLFSRAKTLAFAGADFEALAQLPSETQESWIKYARKPKKEVKLRTTFGDFIGVRDTIRTMDGLRITLYRGMLEELRNRLSIPLFDEGTRKKKGRELISPSKSFSSQLKEESHYSKLTKSNTQVRNQSIFRDGTIFQLTITD